MVFRQHAGLPDTDVSRISDAQAVPWLLYAIIHLYFPVSCRISPAETPLRRDFHVNIHKKTVRQLLFYIKSDNVNLSTK